MDKNKIIINFLKNANFSILHETDKDNLNIEHLFILIPTNFINSYEVYNLTKDESNYLLDYFRNVQKDVNFQNISNEALKFINSRNKKFIYLPITSLNKQYYFYPKELKYISENFNNILCKELIGFLCDEEKNFELNLKYKISNIKDYSIGIFDLSKNVISDKFPQIKSTFSKIFKK